MRIDPTGMNDHDYKKSKETGRLTIVPGSVDNPEYDRIIDDQGNTLKVDKGVIRNENMGIKTSGINIHTNEKIAVTYDFYQFNDKDKAFEFYEFMSNPDTNWVEFSFSDKTNSSGQNYFTVGTIGQQYSEATWGIIFDQEYTKDSNIKLNEMRHWHPINAGASYEDIRAKEYFSKKYPNQNTKFIIDCKECEYDKKSNKVVPRSITEY